MVTVFPRLVYRHFIVPEESALALAAERL